MDIAISDIAFSINVSYLGAIRTTALSIGDIPELTTALSIGDIPELVCETKSEGVEARRYHSFPSEQERRLSLSW